ncbi:unnamed protein product [Blumeria hordei]|uniref:Ca3427-like PBP 2 domain-containing protein n=2 Tax=Blumeria hordei TaxID=2867405 RepID=A0A383UN52_BLUHO|nr:hypothetical protein/uracil-DNA glycosylase [Blumeria hordei DH14]SZF01138.1 unnamed protein product [Blumeria hordei]
MDITPMRIGYVPEHFSTPLHFAQKHFGLDAKLVPFPSGTGHMVTSLRSGDIDIGIGLTEGWVAGLSKEDLEGDGGYRLVGTYVETPLCWAISTGTQRSLSSIDDLKNGKCGVSRVGSGSFVMAYVLALEQGWFHEASTGEPFQFTPLQTFEKLRNSVNDSTVDFFMWEYFTSKKYYDNDEIKKIGEINTPWSSWKIVASTNLINSSKDRLEEVFDKLDKGMRYYEKNSDEAVQYISTSLDYSEADARSWMKTVRFPAQSKGVDLNVIKKTTDVLKKSGVINGKGMSEEEMVTFKRC